MKLMIPSVMLLIVLYVVLLFAPKAQPPDANDYSHTYDNFIKNHLDDGRVSTAFYAGWKGRDDSPWYPTARLFRQDDTHAWDDVIARVHAALRDSSFVKRQFSQRDT